MREFFVEKDTQTWGTSTLLLLIMEVHPPGGGGLLLDVSVKMEIIDFLQPRIKQKLRENSIITPEKCVIGVDYVHLWSPFARAILVGCFAASPFALDKAIETTIKGLFWNLTFLEEGVGVKEKHPRTFLRTRSITESFLTRLVSSKIVDFHEIYNLGYPVKASFDIFDYYYYYYFFFIYSRFLKIAG